MCNPNASTCLSVRFDCREILSSTTSDISVSNLKCPVKPAGMNYGKFLLVTGFSKVRNSTLLIPANLLTQRELLQKKLQQLLLLFLRKLQLFFCQFKGPSPLPAIQDFPIPSKPGHPQNYWIIVLSYKNIVIKTLIVKRKV